MFQRKLHDFSVSPETAWMKETEPGQFYKLYLKDREESLAALLEITLGEKTRQHLKKNLKPDSERKFYKRLSSLPHENIQWLLRVFMIGYRTAMKEYEAAMTEFLDEHPIAEASSAKEVGSILGKAMMHPGKRKRQ